MDEKVTRPNPEAVAARMRLPLSVQFFMSLVDLLAKALQSSHLALDNLAGGLEHKYAWLRMHCGFR